MRQAQRAFTGTCARHIHYLTQATLFDDTHDPSDEPDAGGVRNVPVVTVRRPRPVVIEPTDTPATPTGDGNGHDLNGFTYDMYVELLNRNAITGKRAALIRKVVEEPYRFVGHFLSGTPQDAVWRHTHQSKGISIGDALEEVMRGVLGTFGVIHGNRKVQTPDGRYLDLDQHFYDPQTNTVYVGEQKIRDDHDNTKVRGQLTNFREKLQWATTTYAQSEEPRRRVAGFIHFVDPTLRKHQKLYAKECQLMCAEFGIDVYLFYGDELFAHFGHPDVLDTLDRWHDQWLSQSPSAQVDFDLTPAESFEELRAVSDRTWRGLLDNERLWKKGLIHAIFSTGETLGLLHDHFVAQGKDTLANQLRARVEEYYGGSPFTHHIT